MPHDSHLEAQIRSAVAGEPAAWSMLYNRYYSFLYATAVCLCKDTHKAEDLVQDTFITAYLHLFQLKDPGAFSGWLRKILTHHFYRSIKNKTFEKEVTGINGGSEDELNRKLDWLDTRHSIYTGITHLPDSLRSTIMLRYFSSYSSYESIASILKIPVGTVRSRLNQAKLKLSQHWRLSESAYNHVEEQSNEWNQFYLNAFSGMHHHDEHKNRLLDHFEKDLQLILPGGKQDTGRYHFEKLIGGDRKYGSWLTPVNIVSAGNISIIESTHFNSVEYPNHCPAHSLLILRRQKSKLIQLDFHLTQPA